MLFRSLLSGLAVEWERPNGKQEHHQNTNRPKNARSIINPLTPFPGMADNHAPQATSAATIPAASVPTSGINHPPAYVAVAGGYASVGGPGFPPPAAIPLSSQPVPAALSPSPVSGAPVHAYATAGVGTDAQQQHHTDYASPQQQITTVVPTGGYQGGGVHAETGVVGGDGVNGTATGGPVAVTAAGTGTEATAGGGSTSSASHNGAPSSGGSSKSSLKRVRERVFQHYNQYLLWIDIEQMVSLV